MHAREIVVGPDCSFGYKGAGSAELLSAMARDLGYHLHVIEKEKDHRRDISSTYIREELEKGNVEKANQLLGQPYAIHGEVVHGNHIGGSLLGFPTANILPPPIKRLPDTAFTYHGCWWTASTIKASPISAKSHGRRRIPRRRGDLYLWPGRRHLR